LRTYEDVGTPSELEGKGKTTDYCIEQMEFIDNNNRKESAVD
jgi:hypothetical protein